MYIYKFKGMYLTEGLGVTFYLFLVGSFGLHSSKANLLLMLMSLELLFFAAALAGLQGSLILDDIEGQIFSFLLLAVAASESTIGLSLIVSYYRRVGDIVIFTRSSIKG